MEREPGWWIIESKWDDRSVAYLSSDGTLFPCVTEYDSYLPAGTYEQYRFIRRIDLDSLEVESA
jgi:hypothetical protein